MRREAVHDAHGPQACVASGAYVDMRVADDRGLLRTHANFFEQLTGPFAIGFLRGKTVSAIDVGEKRTQSERLNDGAGWIHRLIGEHGHLPCERLRASILRMLN